MGATVATDNGFLENEQGRWRKGLCQTNGRGIGGGGTTLGIFTW